MQKFLCFKIIGCHIPDYNQKHDVIDEYQPHFKPHFKPHSLHPFEYKATPISTPVMSFAVNSGSPNKSLS